MNTETTTLSSLRNRLERGKIDEVRLAFHSSRMETDEPVFGTIEDFSEIPNTPETVEAHVEYQESVNYAYIKCNFA